jgi:hypothetical protein
MELYRNSLEGTVKKNRYVMPPELRHSFATHLLETETHRFACPALSNPKVVRSGKARLGALSPPRHRMLAPRCLLV